MRACNKRKKTATSTTTVEEEEEENGEISRLPDEILVEIIIRLPHGKHANQCKLVCKHWNSVISSHYFVQRCVTYHRNNKAAAAAAPNFCLLSQWQANISTSLLTTRLKFPVLSIEAKGGTVKEMKLDFIGLPKSKYLMNVEDTGSIQATSHDLLLLSQWQKYYYVINPFIRRYIHLIPAPDPPFPFPFSSTSSIIKAGLLCEYDKKNCVRFKVMRVICVASSSRFHRNITDFPVQVQIYSSESKEWSEYTIDSYHLLFTIYLTRTSIISYKGMFHWLNAHSLVSLNPFDIVVDASSKQLIPNHFIDLPEENLVAYGMDLGPLGTRVRKTLLGFGVTQEHLRVITEHNDGGHRSLLVWQLEESEENGRWSLVHKVLVSELPFVQRMVPRQPIIKFLAFHPYKGDVVFLQVYTRVYRINLRTLTSKNVKQHKRYKGHCLLKSALPPLLQQWFPTQLTPSTST